MTAHPPEVHNLTLRFLLVLGCYFSLHIALRVLISDSLDYDEAEQALLGQWLLAGYTEQPPLYTWLQYTLFQLFGKNVFAVSLLKNGLLYLTYVFVFLSSREVLRNDRTAVLATASLLLIPQIAWESQRDMTHTTLVVCSAAATLWVTLRLVRRPDFFNYCILGLFLGIGVLAKANFAIFVTILALCLGSFTEGRKVIFSPKIAVTLLIFVVMTGNYLAWMYSNQDILFSSSHKFNRAVENAYLIGSRSLFQNSLLFLTPLWCFLLLVFPGGFGPRQNPDCSFNHRFMARYLQLLFVILLLVVLFFKVSYVKDRWLQPLLFCAPIWFFSRLDPAQIGAGRYKKFLIIAAVAAVAVYAAFTIRVAGASYINRFCRMNYPFNEMATDMQGVGFKSGLIISDNRFLAGNMHFAFPGSAAIIPDYRFETLPTISSRGTAAVVWKADLIPTIPEKLRLFLLDTYNIETAKFPVHYFTHRYKYGRSETVTMGMILCPLPDALPR